MFFEIAVQAGEMELFHLFVFCMSYKCFLQKAILGTITGCRKEWPGAMICLLRNVIFFA